MNRHSDNILYRQLKGEYEYTKMRLQSMDEFNDNPVIKENEFINELVEDIEKLKAENAEMKIKISNANLFNSMNIIQKIKYIFTHNSIF